MLSVLIIEDEAMTAMHIETVVKSMGLDVAGVVSDIDNALKVAKKTHTDLVIADININGEANGIETAKILKNLYNIGVLFVTSASDHATLQKIASVEYLGFITKPFSQKRLTIQLKIIASKIIQQPNSVDLGNGYLFSSNTNTLSINTKEIALTTQEHALLLLFISARGNEVLYATIDETIWYDKPSTLGNRRRLFFNLRKKLPGLTFETIKNVGYKLHKL